jgi:hypothetical protein
MISLEQIVREVLPRASAWRLGTSGSANVDVGTPVARLYVSITGGILYMGMGASSTYFPYGYAGYGGGVGVGLEIPVSGSLSMPSFPATGGEWGRLYIPPGVINVTDVTKDTISGPAVLLNPNVAYFGAGAGISLVLFGAKLTGAADLPLLYARTRAVAFQAGISVITPGLSANFAAYQLYIGGAGQPVKM